jgi:hypothetical protein
VLQALQAHLVPLVRLAHQVLLAPQVPLAQMVPQAQQGLQAHKRLVLLILVLLLPQPDCRVEQTMAMPTQLFLMVLFTFGMGLLG